jgi:hypothetical protein
MNNQEILSHYEKYKHLIMANNAKKITCECGSVFRNDKRYSHLKTKKHNKYLNNKA